jgi:hypothetical protein
MLGPSPNCMRKLLARLVCALSMALSAGCAHRDVIPGTNVADTEVNREIIKTVEDYRQSIESRDVERLLMLASEKYSEDSGTPRTDDDYKYDGLKHVLTNRLSRVRSIRYTIQYRNVRMISDREAEVEVHLNGSFELMSESGERYRNIDDFHHFFLERSARDRWKFLSGM